MLKSYLILFTILKYSKINTLKKLLLSQPNKYESFKK